MRALFDRRVGKPTAIIDASAITDMRTGAVSAIGASGASLTLSLKRGGLILPLIILPLLSPAVIFAFIRLPFVVFSGSS